MSGVYANTVRNKLPRGQAPTITGAQAPTSPSRPAAIRAASGDAGHHGELRSGPRVLRLWFKPWEDADGDLFDQGYIYVQVDAGRWRIDHVHRQIRDQFAPIRPPRPPSRTDTRTAPGPQGLRQVPVATAQDGTD